MIDELFIEQNKSFTTSKQAKEAYKQMLSLLLDNNNLPLLQHCTAGKDRTGYGVMLILSILNVDKETIIEDYLLSNDYLKTLNSKDVKLTKFQKLASQVKREYLLSAIETIDNEYGGAINYIKSELGFDDEDIKIIQNNLLEG